MKNLTIPLYPGFPGGSKFPWESPFRTEDIATYERNGSRLFYISLGNETGTRLMGPRLVSLNGPTVAEVPLADILNRSTAVLRISKGPREAITAGDIDHAFEHAAHIQAGDAILITTQWGNEKNWKKLGQEYVTGSPYFTQDGARRLLNHMQDIGSNLMLTDCIYLDQPASSPHHQAWLTTPAWMRPSFPSEHSRLYLESYTKEMVQQDWPVTMLLLPEIWVIVSLGNCDAIKANRALISCLPLFIQEAGSAPCTVVLEDM